MTIASTGTINPTSKAERTSPKQNKTLFVKANCPRNKDAYKVDVHPLWGDNFRVNYWGHDDELGNTIIDSMFLVIEEENGEWKIVDKTDRR